MEFVAVVEHNLGVWVAKCPFPGCHGGEHYGLQETGLGPQVGGLGADRYVCIQGTCKGTYPVKWPDAEMRKGILALLALRPDVANRNWLPHETLHDLLIENADHGIGVPVLEPEREGRILTIGDDRIVEGMDALLAGAGRPELTTPGLLALGG